MPQNLIDHILYTMEESFIAWVIILLYIFVSRVRASRTLLIFMFGMILVAFLKSLFKIPLAPSLGKEGWAFPSGHMFVSVLFWGWLAREFKNRLFRAFVICFLPIYGYTLVEAEFHHYADIFGSIGFGLGTLYLYDLAIKRYFKDKVALTGITLTLLSLPFLFLNPAWPEETQLWLAEGMLVGFTLGWWFQDKFSSEELSKLGLFAVRFGGAYLVARGISYIRLEEPFSTFLKYSATSTWAIGGYYSAASLISHTKRKAVSVT